MSGVETISAASSEILGALSFYLVYIQRNNSVDNYISTVTNSVILEVCKFKTMFEPMFINQIIQSGIFSMYSDVYKDSLPGGIRKLLTCSTDRTESFSKILELSINTISISPKHLDKINFIHTQHTFDISAQENRDKPRRREHIYVAPLYGMGSISFSRESLRPPFLQSDRVTSYRNSARTEYTQ